MTAGRSVESLKIMIGASPGNVDLKRLIFEEIRTTTNAAAIQIFTQDLTLQGGDTEMDIGVSVEKKSAFRRIAAQENVLFTQERARIFRPGAVLCSHHVVPDREMERSKLYQEALRPLFYLMALPLGLRDNAARGLGLQRERSQGPFGEGERRYLEALGASLLQAEQDEVAGRLAKLVADAKADVFHTMEQAVILVSRNLALLGANQAAEAVLGRRASPLKIKEGRLQLVSGGSSDTSVETLVGLVATFGRPRSVVVRSPGGLRLSIDLRRASSAEQPQTERESVVALYLAEGGDGCSSCRIVNDSVLDELDDVEREIVTRMITTRIPNKQIAASMELNLRAFEKRVQRVAAKLGVHVPRGHRVRASLTKLLVQK
ncbi:MAG: hypothetical protein U0441_26530 [Polyangiaceae bacterium]